MYRHTVQTRRERRGGVRLCARLPACPCAYLPAEKLAAQQLISPSYSLISEWHQPGSNTCRLCIDLHHIIRHRAMQALLLLCLNALPCCPFALALPHPPYTYQSPPQPCVDQAPRCTPGTPRVPLPGTSTPACSCHHLYYALPAAPHHSLATSAPTPGACRISVTSPTPAQNTSPPLPAGPAPTGSRPPAAGRRPAARSVQACEPLPYPASPAAAPCRFLPARTKPVPGQGAPRSSSRPPILPGQAHVVERSSPVL